MSASSSPTTPADPKAEPSDEGATRGPVWALPLVLLVALAVAAPSLQGDFVYDDLLLAKTNPGIVELSFASVGSAFQEAYWDFLEPTNADRLGYYRPLTRISLMVGHALTGGEPLGFHVVSVLWHLAATAAAFLLARRMARSTAIGAWTALLFALHPLHVEAYAWISAVNDPQAACFTMLALHAHLRWRDRGARGWPLLPAFWLGLGLFSKELAFATLPVLLAVELGARRSALDEPRPLVRAAIPLGVVLALWYAFRVRVFGNLAAGFDRTLTEFFLSDSRVDLMRAEVVGRGVFLMLVPLRPALFRPLDPTLTWTDSHALEAWGGVALLVGAVVALWRWRCRPALFAPLSILAALSPFAVLGVKSLGRFPVSDRYYYLPILGVAFAIAWTCWRALPRAAAWALLVAIGGLYGWKSLDRTPDWSDEETLFRAEIAMYPDHAYTRTGLGRVLLQSYRATGNVAHLAEAHREYVRAQDLNFELNTGRDELWGFSDDFTQANLGVGWCLFHEAEVDGFGDYDAAVLVFQEILNRFNAVGHRDDRVFTALGTALLQRGEPGDLAEAERMLKAAIVQNENAAEAYFNLGRLYRTQQDWDRVQSYMQKSLDLRPGRLEDMRWLAEAFYEDGWTERARSIALTAHELHPESSEPLQMLAAFALADGDQDEALRNLDMALERDPENAHAHYIRFQVLYARGDEEQSILTLKRVCELEPNHFDAHFNLGSLLLEDGSAAAYPYIERAYRIGNDRAQAMYRAMLSLQQAPGLAPSQAVQWAELDRARGATDRAAAWLERALQLDDGYGPALLSKARLVLNAGGDDDAVDLYRAAAAALENSFAAHFELAELLYTRGAFGEARVHFVRAGEIGPPRMLGPDGQVIQNVNQSRRIESRIEEIDGFAGPRPGDG